MNTYYYAEYEGGLWFRLYSILNAAAAEKELATNRYQLLIETVDRGHEWRSIIEGTEIAAVWFPDGRIWDAYLGTFDEQWLGFKASEDLLPRCVECGHRIQEREFTSHLNHLVECSHYKTGG